MNNQILMVSPVNYSTQDELNTHACDNLGKERLRSAIRAWTTLRNALLEFGKDVIVLPKPPENCGLAVFAADAGLLKDDMFLGAQGNQAQLDYFSKFFSEHAYYCTTNNINFESGDILPDRKNNNLWFGFGQRSPYQFKRVLDVQFENTEFMIRGLTLIDPLFHHLNTCFCPLETGQLLWYPPAFSSHSRVIIETWYGNNNFEISEADARALACNSVSIGWNIIMPEISKDLRDILYINGYNVIQLDMHEFVLAGGACKSLVLEPIQ